MKRLALALLTAVVAMAVAIEIAAAHTKKWPTSVAAQIANSDVSHVQLSGTVSSPKQRCRKNRTVEIVSGDGSDTLDVVYTKPGGSWSAEFLSPGPGPVRVEVGKENFPYKPGHRHVCKKTAETVTIPAPPPEPEF